MISPKLQILILTLVKASLTDDEDLEDEREASGDSDYDNGSGREPILDTKQIRNRGSVSKQLSIYIADKTCAIQDYLSRTVCVKI